MTEEPPATVVCCFDGLSFSYLDDFALPNFSSLRDRGVEAPLSSTIPPWTACAWPSMYTGVDPGHHGVYDFFSFGDGYPDRAGLVDRNRVRAPAVWNYLSSRDRPAVVCNMPVTYPAEPIDGVVVPGYLAPEDADGHPEGVREDLDEAVGGYRIYSPTELEDGPRDLAEYLDLVEIRRRAAAHLLDSREWSLAMIQVQKTDAVFHTFDDREAFRRIYEAADDLLGTVLETVDDDTNVVVCSDHGMGPTTGYRIYLNEILHRHGYVEPTDRRDVLPRLGTEKPQLSKDGRAGTADGDASGLAGRTIATADAVLDRVGLSTGDVHAAARRIGVDSLLADHFSEELRSALERGVDWSASTAYCRSGNELGVRINLAGREPDGVVPPEEYEAVRDDIVDLLSGLETPDGEPAFELVERREAVYDGPHAEDACDVVFLPSGMNHTVATNLLGTAFAPVDTHDHEYHGTFIGAGPGFDAAGEVDTLSLTDVAPILMSLLGCPVPERMTGSVPDGLLAVSSERADYGDVPFGTDTDDRTDDERVETHLENLGYL